MLCGFCCLISQTRGRRACIITSAAALALSSISGLLSRKITSPAEQWNTGSVLRGSAFLLWLLWTSYWKDQEELLQGFEELQKLPCEAVRVWLVFRERNLMTLGQRDVQLHFISSLLLKRIHSGGRDALSRLTGLGLHFWGILPTCWYILVQHFLPMDFLAATAWLRAYARVCGCRAGLCLNPRGGCNQCTSDFAVYAFLEPHCYWEYLLSCLSSALWLYMPTNFTSEMLGALFVLSLAKGKILLL